MSQDRFAEWMQNRILGHLPPGAKRDDEPRPTFVIDITKFDFPISPLYGVTADDMRAIRAHNARVGVFG